MVPGGFGIFIGFHVEAFEEPLCKAPFRSLSGGQRQRVLLARPIFGEPQRLVFDEFTSEMVGRAM